MRATKACRNIEPCSKGSKGSKGFEQGSMFLHAFVALIEVLKTSHLEHGLLEIIIGYTFFTTRKRRKDSDTLCRTESLAQIANSQ